MQMKTFRARSISEAVAQIKAEMGEDAVLVATRRLPDGTVDVTAAEERGVPGAADRRPTAASAYGRAAVTPPAIPEVTEPPVPPQAPIRRVEGGLPAAVRALQLPASSVDSLDEARKALRQSGLDPALVGEVMTSVTQLLPPTAGESVVRREVRTEIASRIKATDGFSGRTGRVVAMLVGPTGVGKTTTIAKIAAEALLNERKRVGLLTLDTFRIGAIEQLKVYADILDVPFAACGTPAELRMNLDRLRGCDLVLIDTAGRNPFAPGEVDALRPYLQAAPEAEVVLTLQATTRTAELLRIHNRHAGLNPSGFVFTKLDESLEFGGLVTLLLRSGIPVTFFGVGQRVPEDLEPARPARLAAALLDSTLFEPARGAITAAA